MSIVIFFFKLHIAFALHVPSHFFFHIAQPALRATENYQI
jgi:hypothetical protein